MMMPILFFRKEGHQLQREAFCSTYNWNATGNIKNRELFYKNIRSNLKQLNNFCPQELQYPHKELNFTTNLTAKCM